MLDRVEWDMIWFRVTDSVVLSKGGCSCSVDGHGHSAKTYTGMQMPPPTHTPLHQCVVMLQFRKRPTTTYVIDDLTADAIHCARIVRSTSCDVKSGHGHRGKSFDRLLRLPCFLR